MNWLQDALMLIQLAPNILQLILQVEQIFGAGSGAAKKAVVTDAVVAAGAPETVTAKVGSLIDRNVASLNVAGKLLPHAGK